MNKKSKLFLQTAPVFAHKLHDLLKTVVLLSIIAISFQQTAAQGNCTATDAWSMFGHDARRSFASGGCIWHPLSTLWTYQPTAGTGRTMKTVERAIADTDGVYLTWNSTANYSNGRGTPALDRVSLAGAHVWTADRPLNDNYGNWSALFTYEFLTGGSNYEVRTGVVRNDDGLRVWNKATGPRYYTNDPIPRPDFELASNDSWGESLVVGNNLWVYNQIAYHGPDMGLRAFDRRGNVIMRLNNYGYYDNPNHTPVLPSEQWNTAQDLLGALASDGGYIYLGSLYDFRCSGTCDPNQPKPFKSGIYAWSVADGTPRWPVVETVLHSGLSVAGNRIYAVERDPSNTTKVRLIIRNGGYNGSIMFASEQMDQANVGTQAPVLAGGRVIIATTNSLNQTVLRSWDAINLGTPLSSPILRDNNQTAVNGVKLDYLGADKLTAPNNTYGMNAAKVTSTMIAATGTKNGSISVPTLIITSNTGIHIVQISNLQQLAWTAKIYSDGGQFRDPVIVGNRLYVADNMRIYAFIAP